MICLYYRDLGQYRLERIEPNSRRRNDAKVTFKVTDYVFSVEDVLIRETIQPTTQSRNKMKWPEDKLFYPGAYRNHGRTGPPPSSVITAGFNRLSDRRTSVRLTDQ